MKYPNLNFKYNQPYEITKIIGSVKNKEYVVPDGISVKFLKEMLEEIEKHMDAKYRMLLNEEIEKIMVQVIKLREDVFEKWLLLGIIDIQSKRIVEIYK